jgi:cyclase
MIPRIIPILLLRKYGLYKGVKFKDYTYIGDPINAVKIFNDKNVHELIFLDIEASKENRVINVDFVEKIADECYMPFAVGGGIKTLEEASNLIKAGAEKVCLNTNAILNLNLVKEISDVYGHQSVVVSIDIKKNIFGKQKVAIYSGSKYSDYNLIDLVKKAEDYGAGEILHTSIDNDGLMQGYNLELIKSISEIISIPLIVAGGAGKVQHFREAIDAGASACAAGSMFVYHGARRGVLINYPDRKELEEVFS